MRRVRTALVLILCLVTAGMSAVQIGRIQNRRAPGQHLLYLPSGRYLRAVTFGYHSLAADLIYLWSIQYYSNYQIADRYTFLDQIYRRVIAELDPHYVDPYLVGSMIMSVEARRDDLALRLLDTGIAANPGEWILPFEAGWICFIRLGDFARARDYFERATRNPQAPPVARRLYAEMFNRLGDVRTSLRYWTEIHDTAESDYVRQVSWLHVHDLTLDVALEDLGKAVQEYRARAGAYPRSLGDLVGAGLIPSVPTDPEGRPFRYDPRTGEVASDARRLLGNR